MKEMEIVLIEDNDEDARALINFLHDHICNTIRLIQDGGQAAQYILLEPSEIPRLILLDVVLPTVDGIDLFRLIKSEPAGKNLSVIFLVSSKETKSYLESLGLHPDGFLKKPRRGSLPVRL